MENEKTGKKEENYNIDCKASPQDSHRGSEGFPLSLAPKNRNCYKKEECKKYSKSEHGNKPGIIIFSDAIIDP